VVPTFFLNRIAMFAFNVAVGHFHLDAFRKQSR
jgi:hypothetical protein